MRKDTLKDQFRREIVGKSIQILRSHGKSNEDIKKMMSKDFSIREAALDEWFSAQNK